MYLIAAVRTFECVLAAFLLEFIQLVLLSKECLAVKCVLMTLFYCRK